MTTPRGYIAIDRRFRDLKDPAGSEESTLASYIGTSLGAPSDMGWDDILKKKLVVVLGEPGSGKSWEFRHRCSVIRESGQFAFFIPLDQLVGASLQEILSPDDKADFKAWKRSNRTARFFLDSVDEAKIRKQSDFYRALDRIKNDIGPAAIERAEFAISSRISEWRPETDRSEVLSRFGTRPPDDAETPNNESAEDRLLVVQIEPLDRERLLRFVAGRGIANPTAFIDALNEHSAWDFVGRPLDALDILEFWVSRGRLGTLSEIIENDITQKLKETTQRIGTNSLSEEKARLGAEALGAAAVFCKRQQFKVLDDSFVSPHALDATKCLPADWTQEDCNALLTRPIFDSAAYGQIRFHHRRIAEYLAAKWLESRMAQGCPRHILEQLLFSNEAGKLVLRKSTAPVAAWLCVGDKPWNDEARSWVLDAAPEIHLEHGDPGSLPLAYRRAILHVWTKNTTGRERVWIRSSPEALRRLADRRLSADVSAHVGNTALSADVRNELILLIRFGKLIECLPALLAIVSSAAEPSRLKESALAAIRDIGTPAICAQVWKAISPLPAVSDAFCLRACEGLFPSTIGSKEVGQLLQKTNHEPNRSIDLPWGLERHIESLAPSAERGMLLAELNSLVQSPPHVEFAGKPTRISSRFEWVLDLIPTVLLKVLELPELTDADCRVAALSLSLLGESKHFSFHHLDKIGLLNGAALRHPRVRRACFWEAVSLWRKDHPAQSPYVHHFFGYRSVIQAEKGDVDWLLEDIETNTDSAKRKLALEIICQLPYWGKGSGRNWHRLRKAIGSDPELLPLYRAFLTDFRWRWVRRLRFRLTDRTGWVDWWYKLRRGFSRRWKAVSEWWWLLRKNRLLSSGKGIRSLAHLCVEAEESGHHLAPTSWDGLVKKRGRRVTEATKKGCKSFWRTFTPQLPHEKPNANQTDLWITVGLSGIQALISDDEHAIKSFTDSDAELATRYAVNEMNGIPSWLYSLAALKPSAVAGVLNSCVEGEWEYPADRSHAHDVLADLAWEGGQLARLVLPTVLEKLGRGSPANRQILEYAISLCLKALKGPTLELTASAIAAFRRATVDSYEFGLWCSVCLQLDAFEAIAVLDEKLPHSANASEAMIQICGKLGSHDRLPMISSPSFLKPQALRRLIPLVYQHIRPADDIDRSGKGAYTPTPRDEAQDFRNGLFSRLAESEDPEATNVLAALLTDGVLDEYHDWIRHLMDDRARKDADLPSWDGEDVRTFATEYETDPKNDRDLFLIMFNRLTDIKLDVEKSDNSLREEVEVGTEEAVLRRFIQRKLIDRSRKRYTMPQEGEIDLEERPDLRAEHPKTAPVPVEVKWANKWTIAELLKGLEAQLVGKYLRAHKSRHGIYVLGMDGRKKETWIYEGKNLSFAEVTELIQRRAVELSKNREQLDEVRVIGIDFRRRPS